MWLLYNLLILHTVSSGDDMTSADHGASADVRAEPEQRHLVGELIFSGFVSSHNHLGSVKGLCTSIDDAVRGSVEKDPDRYLNTPHEEDWYKSLRMEASKYGVY